MMANLGEKSKDDTTLEFEGRVYTILSMGIDEEAGRVYYRAVDREKNHCLILAKRCAGQKLREVKYMPEIQHARMIVETCEYKKFMTASDRRPEIA